MELPGQIAHGMQAMPRIGDIAAVATGYTWYGRNQRRLGQDAAERFSDEFLDGRVQEIRDRLVGEANPAAWLQHHDL